LVPQRRTNSTVLEINERLNRAVEGKEDAKPEGPGGKIRSKVFVRAFSEDHTKGKWCCKEVRPWEKPTVLFDKDPI
jgi:hypothetical protein